MPLWMEDNPMYTVSRTLLLTGMSVVFLGLPNSTKTGDGPLAVPVPIPRLLCGQAPYRSMALPTKYQMALASTKLISVPASNGSVPLIAGLSNVSLLVTTSKSKAQQYFNQGLALTYGFNHDGAIRSFRAAQALDPECAMCFWGEAFAHGPNINAPMDPAANAKAVAAAERAVSLRDSATSWERDLIGAIALRYTNTEADRPALDLNYAKAMQRVAAAHPDNDDVAVLAAEAIMDTRPWDYWEADRRTPKGDIGTAVKMVEGVLSRNPNHAQAIHLYIHLMEASRPENAEAASDRLAKPLMPGAGHLVHMPAHLYHVLGRYRDAIKANVAAAKADESWLAQSDEAGIYRYGYYPHNVHFIVTAAQLGGDKATALDQSARLRGILGVEVAVALPWVQVIYAAPYFAHAQFSSPAEILAQPAPDKRLPYATGMWHYSRAVAAALKNDPAGAEQEIAAMRKLRMEANFKSMVDAGVPAPDLLELAEEVAFGRIAYIQTRYSDAAEHFTRAAAIEDRIPYMEPPFWYYPVRQSLGAAQLAMGQPDAARQSFMAALVRAPNNGWTLYGLAEAQRQMKDRPALRVTNAALDRAWLGNDRSALQLIRL
jgi:tetratricopeptide (TPR) repeat protein